MPSRGTLALLVAGAACLLAAAVGAYAGHAILDERAFADRATHALGSDEVRDEVAARLADGTIAEHPELAGSPAAVEDAIRAGVTEEAAFAGAYRVGAARLHRGLFGSGDAPAELAVPESGAALRAALAERVPQLERRLGPVGDPPLLVVRGAGAEGALRTLAPRARELPGAAMAALALAGLVLLVAAVARQRDRRRGVWAAALAVAASGGLIAASLTAAHDVLMEQFDTGHGDAVATAVWDAFLAELRWWSLAAAGGALVVAAAMRQPRPARPRVPATPLGHVASAAVLLAAAALALALPLLVLHLALVAGAAALVYAAAEHLVRALAPCERAPRLSRAPAARF